MNYFPYKFPQVLAPGIGEQIIGAPAKLLNSLPFLPVNLKNNIPPATDVETGIAYGINQELKSSPLGKKVVSWIEFTDKNFTLPNGKQLTLTQCLITVDQTPNIVKQNAIGKDGSVITYIGMDDYTITIEAKIVYTFQENTRTTQAQGIYPYDEMSAMIKILENQGKTFGVSINSPLLTLYNINRLVFTSFTTPEEVGTYGQQTIKISALSNNGYEPTIGSPYYL